MTGIQIAPSILASDFLRLGDAIRAAEEGGADRLHIDVMDGRFVPNISIGLPVLQAIRSATEMTLETHLMIVEPERYVEAFAKAGADLIIVHSEVSPHIYRTLQQIHDVGKLAGVAVNPGTPVSALEEILDVADLILVMTVNPGFGGQEFITPMLDKIGRVRGMLDRANSRALLEVDGGIAPETVHDVVCAGARVLVAGTSVFKASDGVSGAIRSLRGAAERAKAGSAARR